MGTPPCPWMTSSPAGLTASSPWEGARKANILPLPSGGQAAGKIRLPPRPAVGEPEDRFDPRGIREDPQGTDLAPDDPSGQGPGERPQGAHSEQSAVLRGF